MPREAKPYLERGWWISRPAGRYLKLCREEEGKQRAKELLAEHLLKLNREKQLHGGKTAPDLAVAELFAPFLDAVKVEKSEYTYLDYQRWLTEFCKGLGKRKARDITKGDADQFKRQLMTATWHAR